MTLQQLQYALALEKHGNYSRAAKAVNITQPAMSLQIQNLENQLGILLFDRSKSPIRPTPEGLLFLEKAQSLLTQAHQLKSFAVELDTEIKGEIHLGVIPTLAPYFISLFISDLNEKYPEIKLHIKEAITEEIIQGVKEGHLHAGIISTPVKGKMTLNIQPLFYESFYLYISYKHPLFQKDTVAIEEIPPSQLWLLKEGNCFRDQVNNMCKLKEEVHDGANLWYESNSIDALRRIVEFRGGITFIPELATLNIPSEQEDMIKPITGIKRVREISMVYLKGQVRMRLLEKMVEVALHNIPDSMLHHEGKELVYTDVLLK